jgi:glycosyltransferase involved in cell wall biosynthesis
MKSDNLQILMPAHNEASSIGSQILKIDKVLKKRIKFSFLICEDGSVDETLKILTTLKKRFKIQIVSKKKKQGYSNAVMSGIRKAKGDYLLIMDSDGQCDPKQILKFWNVRNRSDIIAGYRIKRKDFLYRKFFSDFAKLIYRIFFKVPLKDPSFAFSLIRRDVYKSLLNFIPTMRDGFFWEYNARAIHKGYKILEIGIQHKKRKYGNTKIFYFWKLPSIALINFIGLLKVKLDLINK